MKFNEVVNLITKDEVVELAQKMVQFNTVNPPGNEKILADFLDEKFKSYDIDSEIIDLGDNRANVIGRIKGSGERKALLLNGHLDVVPPGDVEWEHGPFSGAVVDGKLYGRGSADMKGGLAGMIMAAKAVKTAGIPLKGDLIVAGTAGEEDDSIGAFHFLENDGLKDVGGILIGEPTSCEINIAEKGAFWVEITAYGKTAHGAFPQEGVNAILHANLILNEIQKYEYKYTKNDFLGDPTLNISTISGGVKTNVVPDKCSFTIDMRTVPSIDHDDIIKDFEAIISRLKEDHPDLNATVKVINNRPAVETNPDHEFIKSAQKVAKDIFNKDLEPKGVSFYTDAAVFLPTTNLPAIIYGPGASDMAHQPNEHITIDNLWEATQFYIGMILEYLA